MMRHWKTIAKVAVAVLTALLGAQGFRSEPYLVLGSGPSARFLV